MMGSERRNALLHTSPTRKNFLRHESQVGAKRAFTSKTKHDPQVAGLGS
jgi:hypothetical protein